MDAPSALRPTPPPRRRDLRFEHVSEIMPEVDRLLAGHQALGSWTLGQACNHLASSFRYTVEGFPSRAPWIVRRTIGPLILRRISRTGRMPAGVRSPAALQPRPGLDDRAEAEALRASIRFFEEFVGAIPEHPFFGPATKDQLSRLHCVHAAHHLAFLQPEPGAAR